MTTKHTPFQLIYGQDTILSIEIELLFLKIAIDERLGEEESLKHQYFMLKKLDESCEKDFLNIIAIQTN